MQLSPARLPALLLGLATTLTPAFAQAPAPRDFVGWGNVHFDTRLLDATYDLIGAGKLHSLARNSSGEIVAWGSNTTGQCNVPAGLTNVVSLGGCVLSSYALLGNGQIVCWGSNTQGQLNVPPLPPGLTYTFVRGGGKDGASAPFDFLVAIRSDGAIVAWGDNSFGQCNVPALPPGVTAVDVAPGPEHALALLSNGQVIAWGSNSLGIATVPAFPPGKVAVDISAGQRHSLVLFNDGTLLYWGDTSYGLGNPPVPPPGVMLVGIQGGGRHVIGTYSDGSARAWGINTLGQATLPTLPPGESFAGFAVGNQHNLALLSSGKVLPFGGNGMLQCNAAPLPPGRHCVDVRASRFNDDMVLALLDDGSLQAWGDNFYGQVNVPVAPPGTSFVQIDVGSEFAYALRSDGQLAGWGRYLDSQLVIPSLPPGLTYTAVSAGYTHVAALRSDGSAVVWGSTGFVPALPSGLTYTEISAGTGHTIAIRSDGSAIGWGTNNHGQAAIHTFPPTGGVWDKVEAGSATLTGTPFGFTIALSSQGDIFGYGANTLGELSIPPLPTGTRYVDFETGFGHVVAWRNDGWRVSWGLNKYGQRDPFTHLDGLTITDESPGMFMNVAMLADVPWSQYWNYCQTNQSSSGCVPTLSVSGVPSASATSGFVITCSNVDGQRNAVLFYGLSGRSFSPWSPNSTTLLCVAAPSQRMLTADTGGTVGTCDGSFSTDWLAYVSGHPSALGSPVAPGIAVNAQAWFRDPPAPRSTNLSDAIEFFTAP